MPLINVDSFMAGVGPWDLKIQIRGEAYPVRRLGMGDMVKIAEKAQQCPDDIEEMRGVIGDMFGEKKPDVNILEPGELQYIGAVVAMYVRDRSARVQSGISSTLATMGAAGKKSRRLN